MVNATLVYDFRENFLGKNTPPNNLKWNGRQVLCKMSSFYKKLVSIKDGRLWPPELKSFGRPRNTVGGGYKKIVNNANTYNSVPAE